MLPQNLDERFDGLRFLQPVSVRRAMLTCMQKYLIATLGAALLLTVSGCMTSHSDTTPPPSRADSGSSPGMTEKTNEGTRSTR